LFLWSCSFVFFTDYRERVSSNTADEFFISFFFVSSPGKHTNLFVSQRICQIWSSTNFVIKNTKRISFSHSLFVFFFSFSLFLYPSLYFVICWSFSLKRNVLKGFVV
jgi:hypothetical protein